jgi:hypothetical protein
MASKSRKPRTCYDRIVPSEFLAPADREARDAAVRRYVETVNKHTAPVGPFGYRSFVAHGQGTLEADHPVVTARMALIDRTKWPKGHRLRCRFLDGSRTQRRKVEAKAHLWEKHANVEIVFGDDPGSEIRISFQADPGSWSALGQECLVREYFPAYQPTMNFGWLEDDTDAAEYERVVVHEFGHALGCIHEHQSPSVKLRWKKAAVYEAFSGPPNYWSREDIDRNVLGKYSPEGLSFTRFDAHSIMLYRFDGSLFTDGKGTPLNTKLSATDKQMIGRMYPKS